MLSTALIAGLARNCAETLPATLRRIETLRKSFATSHVYIFTNDNVDGTLGVLKAWQAHDPTITVDCEDGLCLRFSQRTQRIAYGRNKYLDLIRKRPDLEYLVVMDLDGVNDHLTAEPRFSAAIAAAPRHWGGVFANQRQRYYDVWALRHATWSPDDCWQRVRAEVRPGLANAFMRRIGLAPSRSDAVARYVHARQRYIPASEPPIEVLSAFGGFGMYRASAIENNAQYIGLLHGAPVCEHVSFNTTIRGLYILPSLLNDAPLEHLGPST